MSIRTMTLCCIGAVTLSGCAGSLHVYDQNKTEIIGVPFRAAEVYVRTGFHGKLAKGGATCVKTPFVDVVSLPTGAQYYVAAKTAMLAKTSFHIKYNEAGGVSEIGLDSEPSADTIKGAGEFLKAALPLLGVVAAAAADASSAAADAKTGPACDAGEEGVKFVKLDEYMKR
ncbi:MAG: hypothetical protein ABI789_05550 [Usitatibacter sp.]